MIAEGKMLVYSNSRNIYRASFKKARNLQPTGGSPFKSINKKATGTTAFLAEVPVARCSQSRDCCIGNHLLVFVVSPFVSSHFQTENVLRERSFRSIHLPRSECHPKVMIALFAKRKVKMHSQRLKQMLHDLICQMTHV